MLTSRACVGDLFSATKTISLCHELQGSVSGQLPVGSALRPVMNWLIGYGVEKISLLVLVESLADVGENALVPDALCRAWGASYYAAPSRYGDAD